MHSLKTYRRLLRASLNNLRLKREENFYQSHFTAGNFAVPNHQVLRAAMKRKFPECPEVNIWSFVHTPSLFAKMPYSQRI